MTHNFTHWAACYSHGFEETSEQPGSQRPVDTAPIVYLHSDTPLEKHKLSINRISDYNEIAKASSDDKSREDCGPTLSGSETTGSSDGAYYPSGLQAGRGKVPGECENAAFECFQERE